MVDQRRVLCRNLDPTQGPHHDLGQRLALEQLREQQLRAELVVLEITSNPGEFRLEPQLGLELRGSLTGLGHALRGGGLDRFPVGDQLVEGFVDRARGLR